jgi:hypothetical protein
MSAKFVRGSRSTKLALQGFVKGVRFWPEAAIEQLS